MAAVGSVRGGFHYQEGATVELEAGGWGVFARVSRRVIGCAQSS